MPVPFKGSSASDWLESTKTILTEPLFDGIWRCFQETTIPLRDEDVKDESLGDFVSRRFGQRVADNLLSAVCHGIYAGDIYKMSARTLQSRLWHLETRDREREPGILLELFSDMVNHHMLESTGIAQDYRRNVLSQLSKDALPRRAPNRTAFANLSVYTFREGLRQLTDALEQELRSNKNISIIGSTTVEQVIFHKNEHQMSVRRKSSKAAAPSMYDYVISTLGPQQMKQFLISNKNENVTGRLDPKVTAACEHSNASVNVMVINLYYSNPNLLPESIRGFGYLIPRSVPAEQNPERALGVIFSSETSGRSEPFDRRRAPPFFADVTWDDKLNGPIHIWPEAEEHHQDPEIVAQDTAPGTKLTVMMGGHWWSDWAADDIPSEKQAIEMAQTLLRRHLDIQEQPAVAKARLSHNCIPQYPVGYPQDMATIHEALLAYQGRFKVAGPWWQGAPGMNDCVRSARQTAWAIRDQKDEVTGLQDYMKESWVVTHLRTRKTITQHTR